MEEININGKEAKKFEIKMKILICLVLVAICALKISGGYSWTISILLALANLIISTGYIFTHFKLEHKWRKFWHISWYLFCALMIVLLLVKFL